jgi:predicted glycosyltransferase
MYSHDGFGLGHYRRLLKLATFLHKELPDASLLLITGSSMAHAFRIPHGVDYVKLPSVSKKSNEVYTAKCLPLPFQDIRSIRSRIVLETTLAYQPDVFLVDKHPLGMGDELAPTLSALKERRQETKIVLGIRDILDTPQAMVAYFRTPAISDALENLYDEIWVYGCQSLFDPIREYRLTDTVAQKVRFCGYLPCEPSSVPPAEIRSELRIGQGKFILVTVGSGGDGFLLLDTYLKALHLLSKKLEVVSLLVCGPDMPPGEREVLRRRCNGLTQKGMPPPHVRLRQTKPRGRGAVPEMLRISRDEAKRAGRGHSGRGASWFDSLALAHHDPERVPRVEGSEGEPSGFPSGLTLPSRSRQAELLEFSPRIIDWMSAADVVVSMGGYNTLMEIISLRKEAVVIPRISPRQEQLLRAVAFEKRGLIRMVHPRHLSPRSLAKTILDALHHPALPFDRRVEAAGIDLNGLARVKNHLLRLLDSRNGESVRSVSNGEPS